MDTYIVIRLTKTALVLFFGCYALLVAFGNVTDFNSNLMFIQHVLSMDTTFEGNSLMYRAVTSPPFQYSAYYLIILTEWFIAFACLYGSYRMARHLKSSSTAFHEEKKWGLIGLLVGISLWFFGFQVIGGEWFAMWQSQTWNGLDSAFRLTTYIGIALLALMLKED